MPTAKASRNKKQAVPAALGYRMPAEWEPHAATWIAWPHNPSDWPGKFQSIAWVYADIVRHLAGGEHVHILVNDATSRKRALGVLKDANVSSVSDNISFHLWPTDRVWTRDSGAIFLRSEKKLAATEWKFNAWAKYSDWKRDQFVAGKMARE